MKETMMLLVLLHLMTYVRTTAYTQGIHSVVLLLPLLVVVHIGTTHYASRVGMEMGHDVM